MGGLNQSVFIGLLLLSVLVVSAGSLLLMDPGKGPAPDPPAIDFDEENDQDQVRVAFVSPEVRWDEVQVEISTEGGFVVEGGDLIRTHARVFTPVGLNKEIEPGDTLRVCRSTSPGPGQEVEVSLRHSPSGDFLGSWALQDVDACGSLEEAQNGKEPGEKEPDEPASEEQTPGPEPDEQEPHEQASEEETPGPEPSEGEDSGEAGQQNATA